MKIVNNNIYLWMILALFRCVWLAEFHLVKLEWDLECYSVGDVKFNFFYYSQSITDYNFALRYSQSFSDPLIYTYSWLCPDVAYTIGKQIHVIDSHRVLVLDVLFSGIKIVSNAGGVNPAACAAALQQVCDQADVKLNIAVIDGDDLMPKVHF